MLLSACRLASPPEPQPAWRRGPGFVALQQGAQILWQFNHGTNATKPHFHPVSLPGGPVLTWDRPADHRWHRALWFSWKFINGVNYWEEDPRTGAAEGRTVWQEPQIQTRPDATARIEMNFAYHPATNAQSVLTEHRVIEISAPRADGSYHSDWTMTFTAGAQDVLLERTPLPDEPGGKPYGGYAGLSVRLASNIVERAVVSAAGPVDLSSGRHRGKALALDYAGKFDGQEAGIAIIDSPSNTNSPSPWYVISDRTMSYFSPAVLCYHPLQLRAGDRFTLRYRVVIHRGRWDAVKLDQAANALPAAPPAAK